MRMPKINKIDDDSWAMGVLEPIALLLLLALVAVLANLL